QRFVKEANKYSEADRMRFATCVDELAYLKEAGEFLAKELGCDVDVYTADDPEKYDPNNRSGQAYPLVT
ncbi:MAG: hypothetical protein KAX31_05245, partial [Thermoplasmata archaeon]|nr:hypothetical protein [Thermoplasmata archaeon]